MSRSARPSIVAIIVFSLTGCAAWHTRKGIQALDRGATDQAVFHFEESLRYAPRQATPYAQLGTIHLQAGKYEKAIDLLRRAAYLEPRDDAILMNLGMALEYRGDREEAAKQYLSILERDRAHAQAHYLLSRLRQRQNRFEEALQEAELAIRFAMDQEDRRRYRMSKARIHVDMEQWNEALAEIRVLEKEDPAREGLDGLKGAVLVGMGGSWEEAELLLQSAIQKKPSEMAHRINLACLFMKRKRWEEAANQFEAVLSRGAALPKIHSQLGICYEAMGRTELAKSCYEKARQLDPTDTKAMEGLKRLEQN